MGGQNKNFPLHVQSRSGRKLATIDVNESTSIADIQKQFHQQNQKYYPERQRFTLVPVGKERPKALASGKLSDYGISKETTIIFKDLGPQIAWKTVFIIEYLGPLLIYPLFYFRSPFIYGQSTGEPHFVQTIAFACFMFHYLKREFETLFVHRFGKATMPIFNLFKNSSYYWGNAALMAYFVNHPLYTPPLDIVFYVGVSLFVIGELGNLHAHLILRNLRTPGTNERKIPTGNLFGLVSCANYTFEILAWIGFSIFTQSLASWLFTLQGAGQMVIWALGKHRNYRREFNGQNGVPQYPKHRRAIFPFIL